MKIELTPQQRALDLSHRGVDSDVLEQGAIAQLGLGGYDQLGSREHEDRDVGTMLREAPEGSIVEEDE